MRKLSWKNIVNPVLGAVLTGVISTPIILTTHLANHWQHILQDLTILGTTMAIGGIFCWRLGTLLGVGGVIVISFATVYLSTLSISSTGSSLLNFLAISMTVAIVVLLKDNNIIRWFWVAIIDVFVLFLFREWWLIFIITFAAIITAILIASIGFVGDQASQVFKAIRGRWGPIVAYILLSCATVLVFALWYLFAFQSSPETAFGLGPNHEKIFYSGWLSTIPIFLYQSLLIFATVDPPYPPTNSFTKLLVSLELICSILLIGIYLSLLVNYISQKKEN